jgi:hypothetical protein
LQRDAFGIGAIDAHCRRFLGSAPRHQRPVGAEPIRRRYVAASATVRSGAR